MLTIKVYIKVYIYIYIAMTHQSEYSFVCFKQHITWYTWYTGYTWHTWHTWHTWYTWYTWYMWYTWYITDAKRYAINCYHRNVFIGLWLLIAAQFLMPSIQVPHPHINWGSAKTLASLYSTHSGGMQTFFSNKSWPMFVINDLLLTASYY